MHPERRNQGKSPAPAVRRYVPGESAAIGPEENLSRRRDTRSTSIEVVRTRDYKPDIQKFVDETAR